jgi:hypothetical protein
MGGVVNLDLLLVLLLHFLGAPGGAIPSIKPGP